MNGQGVNLADSAVYEISTQSFNFGSVNVGSSATETLTFAITSGGTIGAPQVLTQGAPNLDYTDAGTGTCTTTPAQSTGSCTVVVNFAPKYAGTRMGAVNLVNTSGAVIATANLYGTGTGPQVAFSPGTGSVPIASDTVIGSEALPPSGAAVDGAGNLYIADTGDNRVVEVTAAGAASVLSTGSLTLNQPLNVAVDGAGNLYIVDYGNNRVVKVTATGVSSVLSTGSLTAPSGSSCTTTALCWPPKRGGGWRGRSFHCRWRQQARICELDVEFLPTVGGSLAGTVNLTDNSLNAVAPNNVQQISLSGTGVDIVITTASLSNGVVNIAYTGATFSASGGTAPYTWSVVSGSLPAGLSLSSTTGVLSGTPTTAGNYSFTFEATDANSFTGNRNYTLTVLPVAPAITTTILPNATVGASYSQSIAATGTSLTWSVASGSLPAGLSLSSTTGLLSGTPTAAGNSTFTIQVKDSYSRTATQQLTLTVDAITPTIASLTPATATAGGSAFSMTVKGTGFDANSVVSWGTTALATTYVSSTQLTVQVTAAAIATAGTDKVTATSSSGTTSSAYQFEVDSANSTSSNEPTIATTTATVTAGTTASFAVTVPSTTTISSVACLNLPTGATCSYASSTNTVTIATASTTPKGTYQITVVFTEAVAGAATAGIFLPFLLLPLWFLRKKLKIQGAWITACMALAILAGTMLATTGCGGSSRSTTGSKSSASSSSVVTLTVQ